MSHTLVSVNWLNDHLYDTDVILLDASYHLPTTQRDPDMEFVEQHIPGALRFDIEEISDRDSDLPHMLPSAEFFDAAMQDLGVGTGMQVVIYDSLGLFSAARAWWMFRYFGHYEVAVLDGGLPAWKAAGCATESGRGKVQSPPYPFKSLQPPDWTTTAEHLLENIATNEYLVLDARANPRFRGDVAEPRPGMRSGHIPGSTNVPFNDLIDDESGLFKSADEVRGLFSRAGVENTPVVVSCGSGVTACVLALGLEVAGLNEPKLYDGSWSEWGSRDDLPVDNG